MKWVLKMINEEAKFWIEENQLYFRLLYIIYVDLRMNPMLFVK